MYFSKKSVMILSAVVVLLMTVNSGFAQTVTWKLAYGGAPNDPTHQLVQAFAKKVEEKSEGRFKLKVTLTGPLGYHTPDTLRFMKQGLAESGVIIPHYLTRDEPLFSVLIPHGVLLDKEDNVKLFELIQKTSKPILDKWDIDLIAPAIAGIMVDWVLIANEPINSLQQLKGKKIRHSDKITIRAMNKLGVPLQYVPLTEIYMALKTGVIDGAMYGRLFTLQQSLYEVTKYVSYMGPYSVAVVPGIGVSKKKWAKLPDDLKEVFKAVGKTVLWDIQYEKWKTSEYEKYAAAELEKKGMQEIAAFSEEDRIKIQKTILEVWLEECKKIGPHAVEHYNEVTSLIKIPK